MRRLVPLAVLALASAMPAAAQTFDVTVKQIFAVPQDSLAKAQQLQAAGTITAATFQRLTTSRYFDRSSNGSTASDTLVRFTGVLLSDPLSSGLASASNGRVGRVHIFVRDVAAATDPAGLKGYVIQVVDGAYDTDGIKNLAPGAVVKFTGTLAYFGGAVQLSPTSVEVVSQNYRTTYPDALGRPIMVNIADLNKPGAADPAFNNPQATLNFSNFPNNAAEYVRIEGLQVETNAAFGSRFNVTYANTERTIFIYQNDVSIRYRNDRNTDATYQSGGFNVRTTPYVPPAVGSRVNVEGFTLPYTSDFVNYFNPNLSINISPFEDGDVVVTAGAPAVANVRNTSTIVRGTTAERISADVNPAPGAVVSGVLLKYRRAGTTQFSEVTLAAGTPTASGTPYSGSIPQTALADGAFIEYYVRATDDQNRSTDSPVRSFRVLANGIRKIEHIQRTATGGAGDSPFAGTAFTAGGDFDITAIVMSRPDTSNFVSIQDDATLAAWSGIVLESVAGNTVLRRGDRIRITAATVVESNGQTRLTGVTYSAVDKSTPYLYKAVTTTDLSDPATAEAHEGMLVRLNDVTVTNTNADAPSNFGEFLIQTKGAAANAVIRVNDFSTAIPKTPLYNSTLVVGQNFSFIQGLWDYSFSNFKLEPEVPSDLVRTTAIAGEDRASGLALLAPSPNPARGAATFTYRTGTTAPVSLDLFDLTGRRVATLVEGAVLPGEHTATFTTEALASGVYVVRLTQGASSVTRSLVVVK